MRAMGDHVHAGIDPVKRERLNALCRRMKMDAILLRRRANIAWLTDGADVHVDLGSATGVAAILWFAESLGRRPVLFTDNIERDRLIEEERFDPQHWDILAPDWWTQEATIDSMLQRVPGEAGIDVRRCAHDAFPPDPIQSIRTPLTDREVDAVCSLGRDAAHVMADLLMQVVQPGMSELEVAGRLAGALRARNILAPVVLIAADERLKRYRHPIPTANRVKHTVMIALCAQRLGLTVSITRLVHFGSSLPDGLRRRHEAVCRVDAALHAGTRLGRRWCECLADGIAMYEACGFGDEWRKHHQGGPMGYDLRDFKATPEETRTVQPRQLVGWNPSITGTKSEDTILTSDGNEISSRGAACEVLTGMSGWPADAATGRPAILLRDT